MRKRILSTALALCMLLSLLPAVSVPALAVGSKVSTSLSVDNVSGEVGETVTLTATLTSSGNSVSGQSVAFSIDSTGVGSATTNASGVASLSYTITAGVGNHTIGASFSETDNYYSSIGSGTLTVTPMLHVGNTLVYGSLTGGLSAGITYYWKAAESGDNAYSVTGSADDYLFSVSYDEDSDIFTLTLNGVSITTTDSSFK